MPRFKNIKTICQIVLGSIFVYASVGKIIDPDLFAQTVSDYQILPSYALKPVSTILPFLELVIGVLLILNIQTRIAAIVAGFLLLIFIFSISSVMVRGINIDCGCFSFFDQTSESSSKSLWSAIFRDIFFLALSIIVVIANPTRNSDMKGYKL